MLRELTLKEKNQFIDYVLNNPSNFLCLSLKEWCRNIENIEYVYQNDLELLFPEFIFALQSIREDRNLQRVFKTLYCTKDEGEYYGAVWGYADKYIKPKQEFLTNLKVIINNPE